MAPKAGTKRVSDAKHAGRPAKKSKTDPIADKCEAVVDALRDLAQIPVTVVNMLCVAAPNALTLNAEDRHRSQVVIVGMIGEVMDAISARLEEDVVEKQAPVDSANEDKAVLDTKVVEKEAEHESLKDALATAKANVSQAKVAFGESAEALKTALVNQKQGDASLNLAAGKKAELEAGLRDVYSPLKELVASTEAVKALQKLGKKYKLEETLLDAAPTAFQKAPTDRGCFDQMVMSQFEGAFTSNIEALTKELAEGDAGKQARAGDIAAAESVKTERASSLEASKVALADAVAAERAGLEAVAAARLHCQEFFPSLKAKMDGLDAVKVELAEFREGAFAGFQELKDLAPAVEPQPEAAGVE